MRWPAARIAAALPSVLALALPGCTIYSLHPDLKEGGRAVAIAVHPGDDRRMLVAAESGGLFRTTDGGKSWEPVWGFELYAMSDIAYAPGDAKVVIATTRSDFRAQVRPIWRSDDGGISWSAPDTSVPAAGPRCSERPSAWGVSFEPGTSNVYVGTDCGLAVSNNLGTTWTHVVLDPAVAVSNDKLQNRVWSVLAQAGGRLNAAAEDGLWYSTNGGAKWLRSLGGPSAGQAGVTRAFAASPFNPQHLLHAGRPGSAAEEAAVYFTTNGGAYWNKAWSITDWGRPVFVKAGKAVSGAPHAFDVYVGNGVRVYRRTYTSIPNGTLVGSGNWTQLALDHPDPSDIAFDTDGRYPILLASDGGLHFTPDQGTTWKLTGGGKGGYHALQIYEITGQEVSGRSPHRDLYFGTQDNYIWASSDGGSTWQTSLCCEGFHLRVTPTSVDHADTKVTGVTCYGCSNFIADAHLANVANWPNPPDGDSDPNDRDGTPFLISPRHYIQDTVNGDAAPGDHVFKLTKTTGQSWAPAFTISLDLVGPPVIAGPPSNPTIYQAVRRPGATVDGAHRIGLVSATNLYGPGAAVVRDADANGTISLGYFTSMFSWGAVFGVNPDDPREILAPDVQGHTMVRSSDGGQTWSPDAKLTSAVTDQGLFVFQLNFGVVAIPVTRHVAFDPSNRCHILVGTRRNGVIRTADGGGSWARLTEKTLFGGTTDSRLMGDVSWIYFPQPDGPVYVSSYGRGIWGLSLARAGPTCPPLPPPGTSSWGPAEGKAAHAELHDLRTKVRTPFTGLAEPLPCERCQLLLVKDGQVTDLELEGPLLRRVFISGGSIHEFDARGRPVELEVPNAYRGGIGRFGGDERVAAIAAEGWPIRGLVIDQGTLVGTITSIADLAGVPGRSPYLRIVLPSSSGGVAVVEHGGGLAIAGEGFVPAAEGGSSLEVTLDGEVVARGPAVDREGRFVVALTVARAPGTYELVVEQRAGRRLLRDAIVVQVVVRDQRPGRPQEEP